MKAENNFIESVFSRFEKEKIQYCVLRNVEEVIQGDAHDIDMAIDSRYQKEANNFLLEIAERLGWRCHIKTGSMKDKTYIKSYHFYNSDNWIKIVHIDIFPTFNWNGYILLSNSDLLEGAIVDTVYHRASCSVEAVTKLFIRLLHNGKIKEKYQDYIFDVFSKCQIDTSRTMEKFLSKDIAEKIQNWVLDKQWEEIENYRGHIVENIKKRCSINQITYKKYLIEKAIAKPGIIVAFEGTDGSGKSTVINGIKEVLENSFPEGMLDYYHWRPGVIKKKTENGVNVSEPHAKKPYGKVKSFAKFMLFNFDYLLGYWLKIRWQLSKGHLVVFDRYYYDYYLDKLRYRLSISDNTLDLFKFMIPKPDITFLLVGDPEVLYERKKEISVTEISQQISRLFACKERFNNSTVIDVNKTVDEVVDQVAMTILSFGSKKY